MNAFAIIRILIAFALAYAAVSIADKKGYYSKVGFFFYGLICPLIAIIHAALLPDKTDSTKKQYNSKALIFNVLAVIFSFYGMWAALYELYAEVSWKGLPSSVGVEGLTYNVVTIMGGAVLPLLLIIAILLARKYRFSLFVYGLYFIQSVLVLIRFFMYASRNIASALSYGAYRELLYELFMIVGEILIVLAFIALIRIIFKYCIKGEGLGSGKAKAKFIVPGLMVLVGNVFKFLGGVVGTYLGSGMGESIIMQLIFTAPAILFIGLFYFYDSQDIA